MRVTYGILLAAVSASGGWLAANVWHATETVKPKVSQARSREVDEILQRRGDLFYVGTDPGEFISHLEVLARTEVVATEALLLHWRASPDRMHLNVTDASVATLLHILAEKSGVLWDVDSSRIYLGLDGEFSDTAWGARLVRRIYDLQGLGVSQQRGREHDQFLERAVRVLSPSEYWFSDSQYVRVAEGYMVVVGPAQLHSRLLTWLGRGAVDGGSPR